MSDTADKIIARALADADERAHRIGEERSPC